MGGSNDDGWFGPSIDEQKEVITALLAQFDPTKSERYTKVERRVHLHIPFLRKGKLTDTYAVAWRGSFSSGSMIDNPLEVTIDGALMPMVWVTKNRQLLKQDPVIEDWSVTTLEEVPIWLYNDLQLGLRGDFETIDREFEAGRREHATNTVDRAIQKVNNRQSSTLATILQLPPVIDTTAVGFEDRRQQCIEALLNNKTLSD